VKQLLLAWLFIPLLLAANPRPNVVAAQVYQTTSFYFPPSCHWMTAFSALGDALETEDGACWGIEPSYFKSDVFYWSSRDPLTLTQNHNWFSSYPYKFVNLNTGGSVAVHLSLGPILENPHCKLIAQLDFHRYVAVLTDGSRWEICPRDASLFFKWILNDCIIIGSNSGWESNYNSILINTNMYQHVRARQF